MNKYGDDKYDKLRPPTRLKVKGYALQNKNKPYPDVR